MRIKGLFREKNRSWTVSKVFLTSAVFFALFSFFGLYTYTIYDQFWFAMFFVYELLFFLGLKSGKMFLKNRKKKIHEFHINRFNCYILYIMCILSVLSFFYFIYSYRRIAGDFAFGAHTSEKYYYNMPVLEKYTLVIMEAGGPSVFLITSVDKTQRYKKLKILSSITLFLIGLRYLLMGSRYVIAVAFLIFLSVKWSEVFQKEKISTSSRIQKLFIIVASIIVSIVFLYIFKVRASSASYTSFERMMFNPGDMSVKPFWKALYIKSNGIIDPFFAISDYLGESPYVFSYYCKYCMPEKIVWGQLIGRSISQMLHEVFGIGRGYGAIQASIANGQGQYSGFAFSMIADFGKVLSPLVAYLYGFIFSKIEYYKDSNKYCAVIYPAIKVICFFAPVFYFFVGRVDYAVLFALIFSTICLSKSNNMAKSE